MAKTLADYEGRTFTSNEGYDFIIVQYLGNKQIEVEFIATGFKKWTRISDINAGKVRDMIAYDAIQEVKQERKNAKKKQCESIKQKKQEEAQSEPPKEWSRQNSYKPTVHGIGYHGDVDKTLPYYTKARELWTGILRRCYSGDGKDDKYFAMVSVCKRWHCLEVFLDDLPSIIGFDKWASGEQMQLDKDLLSDQGIYSLQTCIFLEAITNNQLQNGKKLALARERISKGLISYIPSSALNVKCWNGNWIGFVDSEDKAV